MKKLHIQHLPSRISDINFEDFYDDWEQGRQTKMQRLQARRWRAVKRYMKLA